MYECERNPISNPRDDMMSLSNSSFAPFLRFSSCGASSLPIQVTPSSALTKSQKSSQNTRIARDLRLSLQDSKCFRAFYLARGRHLRASKILVLLAKNHKTKLKIPAFLRGHCTLPSLNSSLGNQFAQSNTAKRSFFRKQEQAAVSLVNTRIVDSQARDSYTNSESTTCHSEAIAEESINHTSRDISNFRPQYDKRLESAPRANLESPVDSEPTSAVGHSSTAIESSFSSELCSEQALKALSGWGQKNDSKGEGGSLLAVAKLQTHTCTFKPLPLNKKENIESKEANQALEVKVKDSEKLDSESGLRIQEVKTKDSKAIDLESKRRVESAGARDSEKQALESEKLEFATDLESKNQAESTSLKALDSHSLSKSTAKIACFLPIVVGRTHFIFKEHVWKRL